MLEDTEVLFGGVLDCHKQSYSEHCVTFADDQSGSHEDCFKCTAAHLVPVLLPMTQKQLRGNPVED